MTPERLRALPVGSVVLLDGEPGEIVRSGVTVEIMWPESSCTNYVDTESKSWYKFIEWLEAEGAEI